VFRSFIDWIGPASPALCSWGAYDVRQLGVDCRRHGVPAPAILGRHLNLKQAFAAWRGIRPCGMKAALRMLGPPLEGRHHRALDDARNIARVARVLLPEIGRRDQSPDLGLAVDRAAGPDAEVRRHLPCP
jgi:inhibitor of KinA sporulation pathway (predicted exonuclease)